MKTVRNMGDAYRFVSDSQDVNAIKEYLGGKRGQNYDSFFVSMEHDSRGDAVDYSCIYGMYGCVPWLERPVYRVNFKK